MVSEKFNVEFDSLTGGIKSIVINKDEYKMEWIKEGLSLNRFRDFRKRYGHKEIELVSFSENENSAVAVWDTIDLLITATYSFDGEGNIVVKNEIKNNKNVEFFLLKSQIGFDVCFYDDYHDAETCMVKRCHTHLWCGKDTSYICLLKMGNSKDNLGVKFTKGGLMDFEQLDCKSNDRGYFSVYPDFYILSPNETYVMEYKIFTHTGKKEFIDIIKKSKECAYIEFENTTLIKGEKARLKVFADVKNITLDGKACKYSLDKKDGVSYLEIKVKDLGEHSIEIEYNDNRRTYAVINVIIPFDKLVKNRVKFIINNQQYHSKGSKLDGSLLIYDNIEKKLYFDNIDPDRNASRERMTMGFLLAHYLRYNKDEKCLSAFRKYIEFIEREVFDEKTGEVFNTVGRFSEFKRLYNGPNMARLFLESYYVFNDVKFLKYMLTIMNFYYGNGGESFYPNGITMYEMLEGLKKANMIKEAEELKKKFLVHINNIIKRGLNYPKHEANYEQTIVSPAVSFIIDAYKITGDKNYLKELAPHFEALERFDGFQPHYKLNAIAIRYWDAYWFGKSEVFGDTVPHQCTVLSLRSYQKYGEIVNNEYYLNKGILGLRNALCCFEPNGVAHCASVFPYKVNGKDGRFLDMFANDQDSILYIAYDALTKK